MPTTFDRKPLVLRAQDQSAIRLRRIDYSVGEWIRAVVIEAWLRATGENAARARTLRTVAQHPDAEDIEVSQRIVNDACAIMRAEGYDVLFGAHGDLYISPLEGAR